MTTIGDPGPEQTATRAGERPESPLSKLLRIVGGVLLTQGRLGHQVLGQLLITNVTESELAGATLVVTAGARQRGLFAQTAVNTVAPAFAVQSIVDKQDRRLARREQEVARRERALDNLESLRQVRDAAHAEIGALEDQLEALRATAAVHRSPDDTRRALEALARKKR